MKITIIPVTGNGPITWMWAVYRVTPKGETFENNGEASSHEEMWKQISATSIYKEFDPK